jgi:Zn-dependent peptidase ImmA (M78 family)
MTNPGLIFMSDSPAKNAAQLIDSYCVTSANKLNIEEIAWAEKLAIKEMPLKNYMGLINFKKNFGIISINSDIVEPGQRKFTIAHEMGHFFNEKDRLPHLRGCTSDDLNSFKSNKNNEDSANEFAAELLMYRPWFNEFIKKREVNFELIKELANHFSVSLSAAAIRYSNIGKYPVAVVYSKNGKVAWSAFHDYFPFNYIPKGFTLNKHSAAFDFFAGKTMQTCSNLVQAKIWFPNNFKAKDSTYLYEQNVAMPNYNAVLTLLWQSEFE